MKRKDISEIINDFKSVHGDKYDYSMITAYNNVHDKLPIICRKHGIFYMSYNKHFIRKQGCSKCNGGVKLDKSYYISKAKEIHGNKYDYSKVEYVNSKKNVCIICPIHGEFFMSMSNHCHKTNSQGCPFCNESKLEYRVNKALIDNNIKFERQKRFNWLGRQSLDFYLPEYNIAIECQGEQHFRFRNNSFFNEESVNLIKKRDVIKLKKCNENGIKILYYSNIDINFHYEVINNLDELITIIKNYGL